MRTPPVILSIAGYDPSSGAGITADIKTAAALGCYAVTCPTALTVQSTQGVFQVQPVQPEIVAKTLTALTDDVELAAVRIGMLGSGEVAEAVEKFLSHQEPPNVVLDPVIRSSSGALLLDEAGLEMLRAMLPFCDVITPNVEEAMLLAGLRSSFVQLANWEATVYELRRLADRLHELGAKAVVITGGHLDPANDYLSDCRPGRAEEAVFPGAHIDSRSTHGTGCAFATALACRLALGDELKQAVQAAKDYVRKAIEAAYPLGKGVGPLNHFG